MPLHGVRGLVSVWVEVLSWQGLHGEGRQLPLWYQDVQEVRSLRACCQTETLVFVGQQLKIFFDFFVL